MVARLMMRARSRAFSAEASDASKAKGLTLPFSWITPSAFATGFVSQPYESKELTLTTAR